MLQSVSESKTLVVDAGNFSVHTSRIKSDDLAVQRRKVELILDGFVASSHPLDVLGIGARDLLMGGEWLLQELNERTLPYVLSNIECPTLQFTKQRSIPFQGIRVDFVSLLSSTMPTTTTIGDQFGPMSMLEGCRVQEPSEWLRENLTENGSDIVVAFGDLGPNELDSIAPFVDIVIESKIGKTTVPPQALDSDTILVGVGSKGKNLGVLEWDWDRSKKGFASVGVREAKVRDLERRQQRLAHLTGQMKEVSDNELEKKKLQRQVEYTERAIIQVENELDNLPKGSSTTMEVNFELKPLNRQIVDDAKIETLIDLAKEEISQIELSSSGEVYKGPYVGSKACQSCHMEIYQSWSKTAHFSAWETLVEQKRDMDPSCFTCHSTGGGLDDGPQSPSQVGELTGVGCESCHGVGQEHIQKANASTIQRTVPDTVCVTCHNGIQNNGEFDPTAYRKRILHNVP